MYKAFSFRNNFVISYVIVRISQLPFFANRLLQLRVLEDAFEARLLHSEFVYLLQGLEVDNNCTRDSPNNLEIWFNLDKLTSVIPVSILEKAGIEISSLLATSS